MMYADAIREQPRGRRFVESDEKSVILGPLADHHVGLVIGVGRNPDAATLPQGIVVQHWYARLFEFARLREQPLFSYHFYIGIGLTFLHGIGQL